MYFVLCLKINLRRKLPFVERYSYLGTSSLTIVAFTVIQNLPNPTPIPLFTQPILTT